MSDHCMFTKKFLDDDFIYMLMTHLLLAMMLEKLKSLKESFKQVFWPLGAQKGVQHEDFPGGHPS